MRKYLIAALAAVLTVGLAAVAIGQGGPASATVSISPSKAGTKKKPKAIKLKLSVKNQTKGTTASRIDVLLPNKVRASGKGLPKCSATQASGGNCPSGSKAGGGIANALINPAGTNPAPLRFKVTAYNSGANLLIFHLQQVNIQTGEIIPNGVSRVLNGKLSRASGKNFYQKIRIDIPEDLQQPVPNVYSALEDLTTTISLKKGKKSLLTSVGCPKSKQHVLGVVITYAPNPGPPPRPSSSAEGAAKCSN